MTDLTDKAIDIRGKKYVLVSDRILAFNSDYKNGSIATELISSENNTYIVKATITPDVTHPLRIFTGYSQAVIGEGMVNKTAALENAETSSVGRALAMMGIGVIDSIASVDEIVKAKVHPNEEWLNDDVEVEYEKDLCPIHNMEYKTFTKNGRSWQSHVLPDKTWCNKK